MNKDNVVLNEAQEKSKQNVLKIAMSAHRGQQDKQGEDYFLHVHAVGSSLEFLGPDAYSAGVLHDVIEDSEVNSYDLSVAGVPSRVINAVNRVSRLSSKVSYADFIENIVDVDSYDEHDFLNKSELKNAGVSSDKKVPLAAVVKLADNLHNSVGLRGSSVPESMLKKRYLPARERLLSVVPVEIYNKIAMEMESRLF